MAHHRDYWPRKGSKINVFVRRIIISENKEEVVFIPERPDRFNPHTCKKISLHYIETEDCNGNPRFLEHKHWKYRSLQG